MSHFSLLHLGVSNVGYSSEGPSQHEICRVEKLKHCLASEACFKLPAISLMTQAAKASLGRQRQHDKARESDAQKQRQDD